MLADSFLERWTGRAPDAELEALLQAMYERGRNAWPSLVVDGPQYAAFLGERAATDVEATEALARLAAEDLYLTCACARGDAQAIAVFDEVLLSRTPAFVGALRISASVLDELRQLLRQKLFVSDGDAPPRILAYGGRGALESWVRIAAVRTALNMLASEKGHASLSEGDGVSEMFAPGDNPELDYIKTRYRAAFSRALKQSFAQLSERDRNLLRFQYLDRLTPERIGSIYGVHRTTALRWLAAATEQMLADTRQLLQTDLNVSPEECDSLLGLVQSRIDVTLTSLFRTTP